jgi:hypothetical protein
VPSWLQLADFGKVRQTRGDGIQLFTHFSCEVMQIALYGRVAELSLISLKAARPVLQDEGVQLARSEACECTGLQVDLEGLN